MSGINRRIGLGCTLSVDPTGSTAYQAIGAIVDGFKGPSAKAETVDITLLSDGYKQFGKSHTDPGETTFMIAYDPDDTSSATLAGLLAPTQTPANWQITYGPGTGGAGTVTTETFKAHLTGMSREVAKDKFLTCEITLKNTGNPGYHGD